MSAVLALVALVAHVAVMLAAAPVLAGAIRRAEARLLGRAGPPVLQPMRDLLRLARKQPVIAEAASWVFAAAPFVCFATVAAAAALVPSFARGMASAPASDLLVLAGLMAAGRFAMTLAAMDTGTAFGGIGASRELTFAAFAEPALFLVVLTLALLAGTTNLDAIVTTVREGALGLRISLGLAALAALGIGIVETGRVPADNPATHLELTMVHEAMLLEYSGRHLALLEWAAQLRLLTWLSMIAAIFLPFGMAGAGDPLLWPIGAAIWAAKLAVLAAGLAVLEASVAKMRVFRVPEFLGALLLFGLLAAVLLFVSQGFA